MPPRPAPSSARRGSSQRQESDAKRAVKILQRLAGAADPGDFQVQQGEERCLQNALPVLWWSSFRGMMPVSVSLLPAAAPGGGTAAASRYSVVGYVTDSTLLPAWVAAVARGMQLAVQQLDSSRLREHSEQLNLLCDLMEPLSCFDKLSMGWSIVEGCGTYGDDHRVALSMLAVRTGVVKAHEQLSLRLTSIISIPQPASSGAAAQQQMAPEVARLATRQLNFLAFMGQAWPGGAAALFSSSLCQAMPAAAGLAAAALRHREVMIRRERAIADTTWQAANNLVVVLSSAYNSLAASRRSVPAQIAGSSSVGTLQLIWLGLAAEQLHQLQHGLSPAAVGAAPSVSAASAQQPRLAVPAHHTQLLQALGVAAGGAHPDSPLARKDVKFWGHVVQLLLATAEQHQHLADAAASCQQPLLLVLLECALLDPTVGLVQGVSRALHRTLVSSEQTALQLAPPLLRAILEQDACRRALEAAAPAAAPAAAATAAGVSDEAADAVSARQVLATLVMWAITDGVMCAICNANGDDSASYNLLADLAAVWLEHPAQYASLLEAGLRMQPDRVWLRPADVAAAAVDAAARTRLSAGSSGAWAADIQQQVFALLLSCIKAATVAAETASSSSNSKDPQDIWEAAGNVVQDVMDACRWEFFPGSTATTSCSSLGTSIAAPAAAAVPVASLSAQLGCVLLARCLVATGGLLQQLAQAPANGDSPSRLHLLLKSGLLKTSNGAVALLGQQLPQQAAAPELQRLLDEHAQLQQQLQSLQAQTAAASGEADPQLPAAALAGVAEQLRAFCAAACTALPLQQCCNHPDCRNLEQASELELVGGKTCVWGGCRVARYCSRECQVAHYKGWHKAVCKRLQAQRQQEAAQEQQQPQQQVQEQQQPETQQQQVAE